MTHAMTDHSPGPWRTASNGMTRTIVDRDGNWVAHIMGTNSEGITDSARRDANERLIVAAPAMFELLKLSRRTLRGGLLKPEVDDKIDALLDNIERPNDLQSVISRVERLRGEIPSPHDVELLLNAARALAKQQP